MQPTSPPAPSPQPSSLRALRSWVGGRLHHWRAERARQRALSLPLDLPPEIQPSDWPDSLRDPTRFYLRCFQYFHRTLPEPLREHRRYFSEAGRGFGEEAFHVLWHLLVRELQPVSFLEIGVYRGQIISLIALLQQLHKLQGQVYGISPFLPAGDTVSRYRDDIDYLQDTLVNVERFSLPRPHLLRAFSTDASARQLVSGQPWDLIYIDGNHDYEVVRADWDLCSAQVRQGGVIVLDDSSLSTSYRPPAFATPGHPGPSRLAGEIDPTRFQEILQVGHNRAFQKRRA